ncbi:hypothetical protein [Pelagivirga sediminicola]|uniref:hypothetical protein n=1 Tax=Pelagivirga sediminicola TaxID=2170575 RepID=UPI001057296B|nr:hypothetical protein [Pelagivirga sediminicola]
MSDFILVSFDASVIDSLQMAKILDDKLILKNWMTLFPNTLLVDTNATSQQVSKTIQDSCKGLNFIAVEFEADKSSGYLPVAVGREIASKRPF